MAILAGGVETQHWISLRKEHRISKSPLPQLGLPKEAGALFSYLSFIYAVNIHILQCFYCNPIFALCFLFSPLLYHLLCSFLLFVPFYLHWMRWKWGTSLNLFTTRCSDIDRWVYIDRISQFLCMLPWSINNYLLWKC